MRKAKVAPDSWKGFKVESPVTGTIEGFPSKHGSPLPHCLVIKGIDDPPAEVFLGKHGDAWFVTVVPPCERRNLTQKEDVALHQQLNPGLSREQVARMVRELHAEQNQLEGAQTNG